MLFRRRRSFALKERERLLQAIDLLEEHGWTGGQLRSSTGEMCVLGALSAAKRESTEGPLYFHDIKHYPNLIEMIGNPADPQMHLWSYNDELHCSEMIFGEYNSGKRKIIKLLADAADSIPVTQKTKKPSRFRKKVDYVLAAMLK